MKTVLIIDDEESIRDLLTRFLKSLDFRAICAESTKTAMNHISESDIVLSDIRIGNENGIDFIRELRNQGVDKRFLLMSGDMYEIERELAIELTGQPVLYKPHILKELPPVISDSTGAEIQE